MAPEKTIEDRVRDRAYALWEKDGRPEGGPVRRILAAGPIRGGGRGG